MLGLVGAAMLTVAVDAQATNYERVYWSFNKHYYQVFDQRVGWVDAKANCAALGAHLLTLTSEEEELFAASLSSSQSFYEQVWLGGSDSVKEGKFAWTTGEKWTIKKTDLPNNDY